MRQFLLGVLVGSLLTAGLVQAKDPLGLGRSEAQQQYDYFRGRAQQLDVENIRKQQENERIKNLGKSPC
jgi:hypothetical protein